jgi:hypothetical protein
MRLPEDGPKMRTETCSNYQIKPIRAVLLAYFYFYCCVDGQMSQTNSRIKRHVLR